MKESHTFDSLVGNVEVSFFSNVTETVPKTAKLRPFLFSEKRRDEITALRGLDDPKARDAAKKRLPAATISGVFSQRNARGIERYNGLVCLDFDAKDNPSETAATMKAKLAEFEEVAFASVSVGGKGVFAIVPTNLDCADEHRAVVELFEKIFAREGLVADKSCKDVCRLRFVSYDPEPHVNDHPSLFDAQRFVYAPKPQPAQKPLHLARFAGAPRPMGESDEAKVERIVRSIEQTHTDITQDYDDWIACGFALAAAFGSNGEDFFQRVSQFHPKYDANETAKKFADLARNGKSVRLGTFIKIANDHLKLLAQR